MKLRAADIAIIKKFANEDDLIPEIVLQITKAFGGAKPRVRCCAKAVDDSLRPIKLKGIRRFQESDQRTVELVILPTLKSISTFFNVSFALEERRWIRPQTNK